LTDEEFDERYDALKAAPDLKTVINFLMGDGPLNGFQFGETPEGAGKYWWRAELRRAALSTAAQLPAVPQEELREDASYESMNLAAMVLSDCGHSSNYTPLLERVAGRIDRHVELLLTAQRAQGESNG